MVSWLKKPERAKGLKSYASQFNWLPVSIAVFHNLYGYVKKFMQLCWGPASTVILSHSQWRAWANCPVLQLSLQVVKLYHSRTVWQYARLLHLFTMQQAHFPMIQNNTRFWIYLCRDERLLGMFECTCSDYSWSHNSKLFISCLTRRLRLRNNEIHQISEVQIKVSSQGKDHSWICCHN